MKQPYGLKGQEFLGWRLGVETGRKDIDRSLHDEATYAYAWAKRVGGNAGRLRATA
uniref:Uncharacterized protein n=1 Tax=Oryza sativa subsp. japonica TaxID=39947 RepID=Q9SNH5_ORYSJ|nr:hypothetical protein [Oryza sativa Japonica Group]